MSEISEPNTSSPHHRPHLGTKPSGWVSLRVAFSFVLAHVEERLGVAPADRRGNLNWWESSEIYDGVSMLSELKDWLCCYNVRETMFPDYVPSGIIFESYELNIHELATVVAHIELIDHLRRGAVITEAAREIGYVYESNYSEITYPDDIAIEACGLKKQSHGKGEVDRDIWKLGGIEAFNVNHANAAEYNLSIDFFTGRVIPKYNDNMATLVKLMGDEYLGWHVKINLSDIELSTEQLCNIYNGSRNVPVISSAAPDTAEVVVEVAPRAVARFELTRSPDQLDENGEIVNKMACTLYYNNEKGISFSLTRGLVFLMILAVRFEDAEKSGEVDPGVYVTVLDEACDIVIEKHIEPREALKMTRRKGVPPASMRTGIYGNINRFCNKLKNLGYDEIARHFSSASSDDHNDGSIKCIDKYFIYDPFQMRQSTRGMGPAKRKGVVVAKSAIVTI